MKVFYDFEATKNEMADKVFHRATVNLKHMRYFILLLFWTFASCGSKPRQSAKDTDSIQGITVAEWKQHYIDSVTKNNSLINALTDTAGAPVLVIKSSL